MFNSNMHDAGKVVMRSKRSRRIVERKEYISDFDDSDEAIMPMRKKQKTSIQEASGNIIDTIVHPVSKDTHGLAAIEDESSERFCKCIMQIYKFVEQRFNKPEVQKAENSPFIATEKDLKDLVSNLGAIYGKHSIKLHELFLIAEYTQYKINLLHYFLQVLYLQKHLNKESTIFYHATTLVLTMHESAGRPLDALKADKEGITPLYTACVIGKFEFIAKLCSKPEQLNTIYNYKEGCNETALQIVCRHNNIDAAKQLLKCRPSLRNMWSQYTKQPLYIACELGHIELIRVLLNACASVVFYNWYSGKAIYTAFHVIARKGYTQIMSVLLNDPNCVKYLHQYSVCGYYPIHFACLESSIDMFNIIIQRDAESALCCDILGNTLLHLACRSNNIEIVKMLCLQYSYMLNAKNCFERTPLHVACLHGSCCSIALILQYAKMGKLESVSSQDYSGNSPFSSLCHKVLELCAQEQKDFSPRLCTLIALRSEMQSLESAKNSIATAISIK